MMTSTTSPRTAGGAGVPAGADAEGKPAPAAADPALARQFERSLRERSARPRPGGASQDDSQQPAAPPWLAGPPPLLAGLLAGLQDVEAGRQAGAAVPASRTYRLQDQPQEQPAETPLPVGPAALRSDAATTTAATAPRDGSQEAALSRHSGAQTALDGRLASGPGRWQLEINPQTLQAGLLLNAERHASAPAGASWSLQLAAGQAAWVAGSQQALAARLRRSGLQVHELQLSVSGRELATDREQDSEHNGEPGDD